MALKDIIGQDKAIGILLRTLQRNRIPSTYLFAGESGIGKKLAAINLAKALNCLSEERTVEAGSIDACDECSSCKKIDSGTHPDFLLISPESDQIKIEEIRAIDEALSLKAYEARYKVVIVDEADAMNQYAANAFLKTLEEPPPGSLIILISSKPDSLPDTIRSRCSRLNFSPLSSDACEEVIRSILNQRQLSTEKRKGEGKQKKSEKEPAVSLTPEALRLLARLSMGSPGGAVTGDLIEDRGWFLDLLKAMLDSGKDAWASKEDMKRWFDFALVLLRDMAVMKINRDGNELINADIRELVGGLSGRMDLRVIIECYQVLNTLKRYFGFNLNKSLTWNYTGSLLRREMDVADA